MRRRGDWTKPFKGKTLVSLNSDIVYKSSSIGETDAYINRLCRISVR